MRWIAPISALGMATVVAASSPGEELAQAPSIKGSGSVKVTQK